MPLATSPDKRGLKRICLSCSTRFYDFNKRPIICPNCETEFTGDVKIKARRSRIANDDEGPIARDMAEETEIESIKDMDDEEEEESDTVSLDEVEEDSDEEGEEDEVLDADLDLDEEDEDLDEDDEDEDLDEDDDEDEDE